MMQEVEVLKTIPELVCSYFSEEQFTLSYCMNNLAKCANPTYYITKTFAQKKYHYTTIKRQGNYYSSLSAETAILWLQNT